MPGGLIALLDDVAALAKLAAASVDDVAGAAGKAGVKAAGVVVDDTAVTPTYVTGLSPERELPIIAKITVGSLRNKLVFLLPAALLLSWLAPWAITPLLMLGGSYLCFEATEKIWHALHHDNLDDEVLTIDDPAELEARQVAGCPSAAGRARGGRRLCFVLPLAAKRRRALVRRGQGRADVCGPGSPRSARRPHQAGAAG